MERPLVTAEDVRGPRHEPVPAGAIVTPLARDLLRRRGVHHGSAGRPAVAAGRLVVANWKSHKTLGEARAWAREVRERLRRRPGVVPVVCPPFTALAALSEALAGAAEVGAQDVSTAGEGAHTGEVAARHLVDAGCAYAIVGHSERRAAGEGDDVVRAKVRSALGAGLAPILCVGETAEERRAGRAEHVVARQLEAALGELEPARAARVVAAYEPRWAIGSGATPAPAEIADMLASARRSLERLGGSDLAVGASVLYGGSVSAANAGSILHLPGCSGALVGGASLAAERFEAIYRLA